MTHAVALFGPVGVQGAIYHRHWWAALAFCGGCALISVSTRFRYLTQNTNWFLGSMLWNIVIQFALVLLALLVHRLWVPLLGVAWIVVTWLSDSPELTQLEKEWRIPSRR